MFRVGQTTQKMKMLNSQAVSFLMRRMGEYPSGWWYLVPILLGFVGGIISYVAIHDDDEDMAKSCFWTGIVASAAHLLIISITL